MTLIIVTEFASSDHDFVKPSKMFRFCVIFKFTKQYINSVLTWISKHPGYLVLRIEIRTAKMRKKVFLGK